MPKLPVFKSKELIKALEKLGFEIVRTRGSHYHLKKENFLVTVPFHNKELKTGTLKSILSQANLTIEDIKKVI